MPKVQTGKPGLYGPVLTEGASGERNSPAVPAGSRMPSIAEHGLRPGRKILKGLCKCGSQQAVPVRSPLPCTAPAVVSKEGVDVEGGHFTVGSPDRSVSRERIVVCLAYSDREATATNDGIFQKAAVSCLGGRSSTPRLSNSIKESPLGTAIFRCGRATRYGSVTVSCAAICRSVMRSNPSGTYAAARLESTRKIFPISAWTPPEHLAADRAGGKLAELSRNRLHRARQNG
jgi:hypothetical protein